MSILSVLQVFCPLNPDAIDKSKTAPSLPYSVPQSCGNGKDSSGHSGTVAELALKFLENTMKPETVQLFHKQYSEGYDIDTDELYVVWSKMKALLISENVCTSTNCTYPAGTGTSSAKAVALPRKQQEISHASCCKCYHISSTVHYC